MSVTKAEFKQIFTAAVAQEFCHVPGEDAIVHTFSETFLRRKEKLIKNTRKTTWYWVNTAAKRAAVIVLLMAMLFSVAMSVEAIRTPVVTFFTELYEKYILMVYEGDGRKEIEREYGFSQLPEGYELVDRISSPAGVVITLENTDGEMIILDQVIISGNDNAIDNEQGTVTQTTVGDISIVVYESGQTKLISWVYDGYAFTLTHYGDLPADALMKLVETIE